MSIQRRVRARERQARLSALPAPSPVQVHQVILSIPPPPRGALALQMARAPLR